MSKKTFWKYLNEDKFNWLLLLIIIFFWCCIFIGFTYSPDFISGVLFGGPTFMVTFIFIEMYKEWKKHA